MGAANPPGTCPLSDLNVPAVDPAPSATEDDPGTASAAAINRRLLLVERPLGAPGLHHFRIERQPIPTPGPGEVLLRIEMLSLEPGQRALMGSGFGPLDPVGLGELMSGQTLARVADSRHPGHAAGDLVVTDGGWQDWCVRPGDALRRVDPALPRPSLALSAAGLPGFAAWLGLADIGQPKPGETVVVAAATGAVGAVVGQIARLRGCRVVGIAGGEEKCRMAVEQLGFDACLSHHDDGLAAQLADACPDGVDIYFELAGGVAFEAVLPLLNDFARVPLCGQVAWANATSLPAGYDLTPRVMRVLLNRRARLQGFHVADHAGSRHAEFLAEMTPWLRDGRITVVEDLIDGLEHAPGALSGLLSGYNLGKLLVRVS